MIYEHWGYFSLVKCYNFQIGHVINSRFRRGNSGANSTADSHWKHQYANMFSCNICTEEFSNRDARDRHKKSTCILSIILRDSNGEEQTIERTNGKFTCLCGTSAIRTDNFRRHWRTCQTQGWIHLNQYDIDNRNNIEEEDLQPNFDGRRVLRFNYLQGLQHRTTVWMGKRSLC